MSNPQQSPMMNPNSVVTERFVTLMYHNITPPGATFSELSPSITRYFCTRDDLKRHLEICLELTRFVDQSTVESLLESPGTCAPHISEPNTPAVQLTFDDGWTGTFDEAGPILEQFGARATVFVTTGLIGSRYFVSGDELKRVHSSQFHIGAHGHTHRLLNELPDIELRDELALCKKMLEDLLGQPVDSLSVPGGGIDRRVIEFSREAGFQFIFTSEARVNSHSTDRFQIGRVAIRESTTDEVIRRFASGRMFSEQWRGWLLGFPKRLLGPKTYRRLRARFLGEESSQSDMTSLVTHSSELSP